MSKVAFTFGLFISALLHLYFIFGFKAIESESSSANLSKITTTVEVVSMNKLLPSAKPKQPKDNTKVKAIDQRQDNTRELNYKKNQKHISSSKISLDDRKLQQKTKNKKQGDFAGDVDGNLEPILRLDWGDSSHARKVIEAGKMKLVLLELDNSFNKQVTWDDQNQYHLAEIQYDPRISYSSSLRIVDNVPAFQDVKAMISLGPGQHLAVLVTMELEQRLEAVKISEAVRQGLEMKNIKVFGGRFRIVSNELLFEITKIQKRRVI